MPQAIPGFWPAVDQGGLKLAPVKRGEYWLALLKTEPGVRELTPHEEESILRLGFQKGQDGRYVLPGLPNQAAMHSLATLFGGEVKPLEPEKVFYLKGSQQLEPPIPDSLRAGVAWWWGANRQQMMREIRQSLHQSDDEYAKEVLNSLTPSRWRNPDQLRFWMEYAFGGELNAVTEPILGMGLAKAAQLYDGELPEELEQWRVKLAEFRGDPEPETADLRAPLQAEADEKASQRPAIGSPVEWSDDAGRHYGRVTSHSAEQSDAFWVTSDQPQFVAGMPIPKRHKITLDQLANQPVPPTAPKTNEPDRNGQTYAKAQRWTLTLEDIDNTELRSYRDEGRVNETTRNTIRGGIQSGTIVGKSPLLVTEENDADALIPNWFRAREALGLELGSEETPEVMEAKAFLRDDALARFNALQPEIHTAASSPVLAVIPLPATRRRDFSNSYDDPETQATLEESTVYAVGLHPSFAKQLSSQDNMDSLLANVLDPHTRNGVYDEAALAWNQKWRDQSLMMGGLVVGMPTTTNDGLRNRLSELREQALESEDPDQAMMALSHGRLALKPETAQSALKAAVSDRSALPEDLLARNKSAMNSIAHLAGKSRHSLETLQHPMFWLFERMEAQGVMNGWTRPEQMAALGIDLQSDYTTAGELASLAGASLQQVNEQTVHTDDSDHMHNPLRAAIASGLVSNEDGARAFTVGLVDTSQEGGQIRGLPRFLQFEEREEIAGQTEIATLGKLASMGAEKPIRFSTPLKEAVVTQEVLNTLDPTWYHTDHISSHGLVQPVKGAVNTDTTGSDLEVPAFPESEGATRRHLLEAAGNTAKGLQVLSSKWRHDKSKHDELKQAVNLWLSEHKHNHKIGDAARERITREIIGTLANTRGAEMVVFASKATRNGIRYLVHAVTEDDIQEAGFDRGQAAELVAMRAKNRRSRGTRTDAFDAMSVLKPEALRYLNELKAEQEKQRELEAKSGGESKENKPAKRGARQNRGLVAGLSVKDLRGKAETVITNLTNASAEDQKKMARKTRLWETPDWVDLRNPKDPNETAMDPLVAGFWSELRKELPAQSPANVDKINGLYAECILGVRDLVGSVRTVEQLKDALEPEGELFKHLKGVHEKAKELELSDASFLGQRLHMGVRYGLDRLYFQGERLSRNNTEWPAKLGRSRAAAAKQGEKYGAMPALKSLTREGEDYRKGLDTDEETLIRTFGFSGVEYGESMPQRERTEYLNHAYDGFMDLSRVLNVDPQALSLGGSLGLAFGSRGKGGRSAALAHFEPQNNVINLTRLKGAGSMAHEYGHALANYFHRMTTGQVRGPGDLTRSIGSQQRIRELEKESIGQLRKPVYDAFATIMAAIRYEPAEGVNSEKPSLSPRDFPSTMMGATELYKGALLADRSKSGRSQEKYWATPHEMFARSFETWVNHHLNGMDGKFRNDFLVRPDKLEVWGVPKSEQELEGSSDVKPQLYPAGEHLKILDKAFGQLVKEIQTASKPVTHEHLGKINLPYLYSHDAGSIEQLSEAEMGAVAQSVISEVARMCGDAVAVQWERELRDDAGSLIAGRFATIEGEPDHPGRGLRGLIELAYGAPVSTAYHEAFHFAQEVLLQPEERAVLDHEFSEGQPLHDRLVATLENQGKAELVEGCDHPREAQAYAYQEWVNGNLDLKVEEQPKTFFGQIKDFCKKLLGVTQSSGFQEPESLFRAFYDGRLAARHNLEQSIERSQEAREQQAQSASQGLSGPQTRESKSDHADTSDMNGWNTADEPAEEPDDQESGQNWGAYGPA